MVKDRIDLEQFGGHSYFPLALFVKCKNLQIDLNRSREIQSQMWPQQPADYMKNTFPNLAFE